MGGGCAGRTAEKDGSARIGSKPNTNMIPDTMKTADLHEATLVSLKIGGDPLVEELGVCTGREVLTINPGPLGTLVFVVRRPG